MPLNGDPDFEALLGRSFSAQREITSRPSCLPVGSVITLSSTHRILRVIVYSPLLDLPDWVHASRSQARRAWRRQRKLHPGHELQLIKRLSDGRVGAEAQ